VVERASARGVLRKRDCSALQYNIITVGGSVGVSFFSVDRSVVAIARSGRRVLCLRGVRVQLTSNIGGESNVYSE